MDSIKTNSSNKNVNEVAKNSMKALEDIYAAIEFKNQKRMDEYSNVINDLKIEKEELETNIKNLHSYLEKATASKLQELKLQEQDNEGRKNELENQLVEARDIKNTLIKQRENLERQKKNFDDDYTVERKRLSDYENILKEKINNNNKLEASLRESESVYQSKISEMSEKISSLQKSQGTLNDKILMLQQQIDENNTIKEELASQTSQIKAREKELDLIISINNDLQASLSKQIEDSKVKVFKIDEKTIEMNRLIDESNQKIKQIAAESERNNINAIANKAKEKLLNEKERALNDREKNINILEKKIGA